MTAAVLHHPVSFRLPTLPWSSAADDERRFQRIARTWCCWRWHAGPGSALVPLRTPRTAEIQPLPAPMARLLLDDRPLPPPAPPVAQRSPCRSGQGDTRARARKARKPRYPRTRQGQGSPGARSAQPRAGKPPGEVALDNARRKASGVGLLAMKNELRQMTGAPLAVQLQTRTSCPAPVWAAAAGPASARGNEAGLPARALITSNATQGSGGINTAAYSRDTGGGGLAGRATTLVEGVAGGGGGGGPGGGGGRGKRHRHGAAKGRPRAARCKRAAAARPAGPSKRSSSSSNATRARSTRSTTARCATTPRCRARWCWS
jgi:hypothetical protein